ncbi:MAG: hypothetical protein HY319_31890 [Armatimonadetes bacterium]|nr:hypothetical protein [Armatimonadota bacterium]
MYWRRSSPVFSAFLSTEHQNTLRLQALPEPDDPDWIEWRDSDGNLLRFRLLNHPEGCAPTIVSQHNGVFSIQPPVQLETRISDA